MFNFKQSHQRKIFGIVLGLFLVNTRIPRFLAEAFRKTNISFSKNEQDLFIVYACLKNAPSFDDGALKKFVTESL